MIKKDEFYFQSSNYPPSSSNLPLNLSFNYVTSNNSIDGKNSLPSFKGGEDDSSLEKEWISNDSFPTFLFDYNYLLVPKGTKRSIERLPKSIWSTIDTDKQVALDKCMIFVSNLTSLFFKDDMNDWKSLSSHILHEQLKKGRDNSRIYPQVINALKYATDSSYPIIECKLNTSGRETYEAGSYSKQYRFNSHYRQVHLTRYEITTLDCLQKRFYYIKSKLNKFHNNPILKNLISLYPRIELPTSEEALTKGRQLVKEKYVNKKGKLLTVLNKKSKSHYTDLDNRTFVEDNIELFKQLTDNGYIIPSISDFKAGGRVTDSFNLMPSWIRRMCKIDGEPIVELDYTCLHPNIAISLFGGFTKCLNHSILATSLGKSIRDVKIEHLSFFNKHWKDMEKSLLYEYYAKMESEMLQNIIIDKKKNNYKNTSKLLFGKEVEIMAKCIEKLNVKGIYVMYVYDALYCKESDSKVVKEVMNDVILENGVFTHVK